MRLVSRLLVAATLFASGCAAGTGVAVAPAGPTAPGMAPWAAPAPGAVVGMVPQAGGAPLAATTGATAGATVGATVGATTTAGNVVAAPAAGAVLATGATGVTLTRDNADAFVDAFSFSLAQVGRPKTFTAADREQLIAGLVEGFPKSDLASQQAMAGARATWTRTQAGWAMAAPQEQQAFVSGVLSLAVGEQGSAQLTGQATPAAGGGGGGEDPWAAEAREKCANGSFEDKMFYCHGQIVK